MSSDVPSDSVVFDRENFETQATAVHSAAERVGLTSSRLHRRTEAVVREFIDTIAQLSAALHQSRTHFSAEARRVQRWRSQWLSKQEEEVDAVEKLLGYLALLCRTSGSEGSLELVHDSVLSLLLCAESSTLPRLSLFVGLDPALQHGTCGVLLSMRVQTGPHPSFCSIAGSGARACVPGASESAITNNCLKLVVNDDVNEPVLGLEVEDVVVVITSPAGASVPSAEYRVDAAPDSTVSVALTIAVECELKSINVQLLVGCVPFPPFSIPVSRGIQGQYVGTIPLKSTSNNYGLAVSADGAELYVSNWNSYEVTVHSASTLMFMRSFGTEAAATGVAKGRSSYEEQQFNDPYKMSVTHRGTLLVVEDTLRRVQEVNVSDGSCIRVIKSSEFSVRIQAVACTDQLIAVGAMSSFSTAGNRISLFGFDDGKLLRSFVGCGSEYALGQLRTCYGLRFTLDGLQLIAVDHDGSRVSVYTTGGAFVKTLGAPELCNPSDVELCGDSCIAVADRGNHCVRILSMDTGECVRSFGAKGKESGEFSAPTALATHGGVLYVLDRDSGRVQAFR